MNTFASEDWPHRLFVARPPFYELIVSACDETIRIRPTRLWYVLWAAGSVLFIGIMSYLMLGSPVSDSQTLSDGQYARIWAFVGLFLLLWYSIVALFLPKQVIVDKRSQMLILKRGRARHWGRKRVPCSKVNAVTIRQRRSFSRELYQMVIEFSETCRSVVFSSHDQQELVDAKAAIDSVCGACTGQRNIVFDESALIGSRVIQNSDAVDSFLSGCVP